MMMVLTRMIIMMMKKVKIKMSSPSVVAFSLNFMNTINTATL